LDSSHSVLCVRDYFWLIAEALGGALNPLLVLAVKACEEFPADAVSTEPISAVLLDSIDPIFATSCLRLVGASHFWTCWPGGSWHGEQAPSVAALSSDLYTGYCFPPTSSQGSENHYPVLDCYLIWEAY